MKWPWVSRARLEDAQRRIAELEEERRALWDRNLQVLGQTAFFAEKPATASATKSAAQAQAAAPVTDVAGEETKEPERVLIAGSLTPDYIRGQFATAAAHNRIGIHLKRSH